MSRRERATPDCSPSRSVRRRWPARPRPRPRSGRPRAAPPTRTRSSIPRSSRFAPATAPPHAAYAKRHGLDLDGRRRARERARPRRRRRPRRAAPRRRHGGALRRRPRPGGARARRDALRVARRVERRQVRRAGAVRRWRSPPAGEGPGRDRRRRLARRGRRRRRASRSRSSISASSVSPTARRAATSRLARPTATTAPAGFEHRHQPRHGGRRDRARDGARPPSSTSTASTAPRASTRRRTSWSAEGVVDRQLLRRASSTRHAATAAAPLARRTRSSRTRRARASCGSTPRATRRRRITRGRSSTRDADEFHEFGGGDEGDGVVIGSGRDRRASSCAGTSGRARPPTSTSTCRTGQHDRSRSSKNAAERDASAGRAGRASPTGRHRDLLRVHQALLGGTGTPRMDLFTQQRRVRAEYSVPVEQHPRPRRVAVGVHRRRDLLSRTTASSRTPRRARRSTAASSRTSPARTP